jgi:hypothetical protein
MMDASTAPGKGASGEPAWLRHVGSCSTGTFALRHPGLSKLAAIRIQLR